MRGIKFPAIYCKVVFFLSTFLCCSLVFGGEVFSRLDELVQEALAKNPDIRASLQRCESARAVIPQVQTLPDPKVTMGYRDMARQDVMYGLSQEIPFPGKLGLKGEIAARRSDRIEQDYLAT